MNKYLYILLFVCALSGCKVGPDFKMPKTELPKEYSYTKVDSMSKDDLVEWWKLFGDDKLTNLIERVLQNNFDLLVAKERVEQARATLGIYQSALFPSLDTGGDATLQSKQGNMKQSNMFYGAGASASWELDIFGGSRREVESAVATYKGALASKCAVRVLITAELARTYFLYRSYQQNLMITRQNLETQKRTYEITKEKREAGFAPLLDVVRSRALVESTSSQIPAMETNMTQARFAIEFLLGLPSGSLEKELSEYKDLPVMERYIPKSVPANLVERRPDIIVATNKIHSATAKIGSAKSDLLPKFYITGRISYEAPNAGNVFKNQYGTWSVGPSFSWNLFQAGKTFYNIKLQEAITREAGISWQAAVLNAFKEVEDNLVASFNEKERIKMLVSLVEMNKKAVDISNKLYSGGEIEFMNVLDTERALLSSELTLIASRQNFISNLIYLYKSLGGGWAEKDMENPADLTFDLGILSD